MNSYFRDYGFFTRRINNFFDQVCRYVWSCRVMNKDVITFELIKECSKSVFPPILTNGFGILELNLLLSPAANKIKQKLIILIYLIFM